MRYFELNETAEMVNLTPAFLRRVRATTNRIASDIAADLPRGQQFVALLRGLLEKMDVAPTMMIVRAELRPQESITGITSVGCHWCWDPDQARVYHHDNAYDDAERDGYDRDSLVEVTFVAEVAFRNVDWVYTLATNCIHPAEREITVRSGAQVMLVEAFTPGGYQIINHLATADGYYNE